MKQILTLIAVLFLFSCSSDSSREVVNSGTGQQGSITRFVISGSYMYAIDFNYLKIFSLANNDDPVFLTSIKIGYGLETIFVYGNYIYIGASDGVYVLSVTNPLSPVQLQKIEHHISCDPVVVQGNYAYSTQRVNAVGCGTLWQMSALAVYDVTAPAQASLVTSINMEQPFGLAVEGNWLFVCDQGKGGIIVYDISNPANPVEVTTTTVSEPRDIILMYPYMVVSTRTKFQLYNYSNPLNIYPLGSLTIS
jgi:hypothetical protein